VLDVTMTATARLADYVFGCKLSLEKPGTSRTAEGQLDVPFAQYTPALIHPDFDVIEEWEFFWGLAHRMRTPLALEQGSLDLDRKPTSDEYLDLTHRGSRVTLDEVRKYPGGRVFEPTELVHVEPGRPEAADFRMNVAPGAVIEQLVAIRAEARSGAGFTHRLVSRRMLEVYNSTGDRLPRLRRRYPYNPAFMHPTDLVHIGVRPGDVVRIDSDHDFIYGVAEATTDVRPGVVSMAHARGGDPALDGRVRTIGSTTGRLVSVERDFEPISGIPRQSAIPVNVRALRPEELAAIEPGEPALSR
jgi:anaerobic selenocysteine-containing dehydrogenase